METHTQRLDRRIQRIRHVRMMPAGAGTLRRATQSARDRFVVRIGHGPDRGSIPPMVRLFIVPDSPPGSALERLRQRPQRPSTIRCEVSTFPPATAAGAPHSRPFPRARSLPPAASIPPSPVPRAQQAPENIEHRRPRDRITALRFPPPACRFPQNRQLPVRPGRFRTAREFEPAPAAPRRHPENPRHATARAGSRASTPCINRSEPSSNRVDTASQAVQPKPLHEFLHPCNPRCGTRPSAPSDRPRVRAVCAHWPAESPAPAHPVLPACISCTGGIRIPSCAISRHGPIEPGYIPPTSAWCARLAT